MKRPLAAALALLGFVTLSAAQVLGPSSYVQASDSPFSGMTFDYFYLEDFEDGFLNTLGASSNTSTPGSSFGSGLVDSVDGDDGIFDGNGNAGESLWGSGEIFFDFSEAALGTLPTHVGIVWTDGVNDITFEAYDAGLNLVGTLTGSHADADFGGGTAEDRFYGIIYSGGIKRIRISNPSGIEVDHLQYGAVPEPATGLVLLAGLPLFARRRRQKKS